MGREQKRFRERAAARLLKRLRRSPSEAELHEEIDRLHKAQGQTARGDRTLGRKEHTPRPRR
jgi:hypothetical protein